MVPGEVHHQLSKFLRKRQARKVEFGSRLLDFCSWSPGSVVSRSGMRQDYHGRDHMVFKEAHSWCVCV